MNKKGNVMLIIVFIGALALIMLLGVGMLVGSSILNWTFDEVIPEVTTVGVIGDTNVSEAAEYAFTPVNNVVQSATWGAGVIYIIMIAGVIIFAFIARSSGSRWTLALFLGLVVLLLVMAIVVSNIYEDFRDGDDELGTRLREHALLDYMVLHSPVFIIIIALIGGIIIYSGIGSEAEAY